MRKILLLLCLAAALGAMAADSHANVVEGMLKSVDKEAKKLEIDADNGMKSVAYTTKTKWPESVHNPSDLVGKTVKVDQDDLLEEAVSVTEA